MRKNPADMTGFFIKSVGLLFADCGALLLSFLAGLEYQWANLHPRRLSCWPKARAFCMLRLGVDEYVDGLNISQG